MLEDIWPVTIEDLAKLDCHSRGRAFAHSCSVFVLEVAICSSHFFQQLYSGSLLGGWSRSILVEGGIVRGIGGLAVPLFPFHISFAMAEERKRIQDMQPIEV